MSDHNELHLTVLESKLEAQEKEIEQLKEVTVQLTAVLQKMTTAIIPSTAK